MICNNLPLKKKSVGGISLISSALCNMHCTFCYLDKNIAYKDYSNIVREAWQSGEYLINVENTLKALNVDFAQIVNVQLWGGETLLYIDDLIPNLPTLFRLFPNLTKLNCSTNWTTSVEEFVNFLITLDNISPNPITFTLQCSIDGPEGVYTEEGHNGKWEEYYKNFDLFFNLMNNHRFKHMMVELVINATVNQKTYLEKFSDEKEMRHYVESMAELTDYLYNRSTSESVECLSGLVFPGYALPYETSSSDGRKFASILKLWDKVRAEYFPQSSPYYHFGYGIGAYPTENSYFMPNTDCGEVNGSLTIGPDGEIVECSGSFIDHYHSYQEELKKDNNLPEYYASKIRERIQYNPGKMTKEELNRHEWYIDGGYKNTSSIITHTSMSILKELAASGQIEYKYLEDENLLLKHLLSIGTITACPKENLRDTALPYIVSPSCFRRYFNGAAEYSYDMKLLEIKKQKQEELDKKMKEYEEKNQCQ